MKKLEGKVAIITGASSGIGKAGALLFASEGAALVLVDHTQEEGEKIAEEIKANGSSAIFLNRNLEKTADIENAVQETVNRYGRIDVVWGNAGVTTADSVTDVTEEMWDKVIDINLKANFFLTKYALPYLLQTKGTVLFTSSVAAFKPTSKGYAYGASKAGLDALTKSLALCYAEQGVRFNTINPGVCKTGILTGVPETHIQALKDSVPMKRLETPEDIARVALFVVSEDASFMTGANILIDGGFRLA